MFLWCALYKAVPTIYCVNCVESLNMTIQVIPAVFSVTNAYENCLK